MATSPCGLGPHYQSPEAVITTRGAQPSWLRVWNAAATPGCSSPLRTHCFIFLGGAKALLLDARHVEYIGVRQRLLDALKFLLDSEARAG